MVYKTAHPIRQVLPLRHHSHSVCSWTAGNKVYPLSSLGYWKRVKWETDGEGVNSVFPSDSLAPMQVEKVFRDERNARRDRGMMQGLEGSVGWMKLSGFVNDSGVI